MCKLLVFSIGLFLLGIFPLYAGSLEGPNSPPASHGVTKTGQTTLYASGDDGDLKKGFPASGAKYTDNGDNTVTDNGTRLMWIKDHAAIGAISGYNWALNGANAGKFCWNRTYGSPDALSAIAALNAANYAGHNDWRLPNIKELQSLVNYGNINTAIGETTSSGVGHETPFTNTQSEFYWSSTTNTDSTDFAWYVHFRDGFVGYDNKDFFFYVRPVRGG